HLAPPSLPTRRSSDLTEAEALAATRFSTVVFDEGHLLKNARTQRSVAAFALDAGFRVALTGTPVENHLCELWSVMRAIVPGLLGDRKSTRLNSSHVKI